MKAAVSVHGRFHAFELANGLHARGLLAQLATTYPSPIARRHLVSGVRLKTAPWLEFRRRLYSRFAVGPAPDLDIARKFGRFAASTLPADATVLIGWSSATLEAIGAARERGMKVVIERGSSHIGHQTEVLGAAYAAEGLEFTATAAEMIAREEAEYAAADAIAVPTAFAAGTFVQRGIAADKLIVNPYGVDLDQFSAPPDRPRRDRPRILFVGGLGVRKGVPNLLRAFANLKQAAELHLVGPVEADFRDLLGRLPSDGVTVHGPVARRALARQYRLADIFCLPSVEEGMAMVLLQAMAAGLPIVATEASGAADLIDGEAGRLVAPGDAAALEAALADLIGDPDRRRKMGRRGGESVRQGYSWTDYVGRAVTALENLHADD